MLQDSHRKVFAREYVVKNAVIGIEGQTVSKTFEVDVLAGEKYYLMAWVMGTGGEEGMNRLQVYLDDQEQPVGTIEMSRTGWQPITVRSRPPRPVDRPLPFSFGRHAISFRCEAPEVPAVELIHLARDPVQERLGSRYDAYLDSLKDRSLPEDYKRVRDAAEGMASSNPEGDYAYKLDLDFNYTFYKYFYFTVGTHVVFETKKKDPYGSDPYMYLFRYREPIYKSTWANDDGGAGWQSKISARIQHTDLYILLLRAYSSGHPGTSDLWKDSSLYVADVPFAGTKLSCGSIVTSEPLNFFTAHLVGDSRLWLQSFYTGNGIVAYSDDYYGSGDFGWGLASRTRGPVYRIRYAIVSAFSSYQPTGTCDVYMGCRDSTIMSSFPSLKADDAIRSAPQSSAYNCISWAGGRTDLGRYFWPPDAGNPWRGSTDLESFDNFFGNTKNGLPLVRYNGAMNYTRSGANAGNAVVALWATGSYKHASVRRPGNAHPHGYDWESKPGGLMRTFHPRDALEGDSYGQIVAYYRWDGSYAYGSAPMGSEETGESDRMAEIDRAEVVESDREKLYELLSLIPEEVTQEFEQTYQAWKATWDDPKLQIHSNPRMFAQSEEYERLRSYCQEKGKIVWPLVFSKYEEGEELVTSLIEDLTLDEYAYVMDEILDENLERAKDVIPSQKANWTRYVIQVTSQLYEEYEGEKP